MTTLVQICKEKVHAEQGKTLKNVQFEEKRGTRKYNGAKASAQGDTKFKDNPDVKWNKESGDLRARPHPAQFPFCERK